MKIENQAGIVLREILSCHHLVHLFFLLKLSEHRPTNLQVNAQVSHGLLSDKERALRAMSCKRALLAPFDGLGGYGYSQNGRHMSFM